jgi:pimeloyl-ACP methyl ester carboxylesterase
LFDNPAGPQDHRIIPLDPLLENFNYPYPVKFISLIVQRESYRMAYMDVRPSQPNGRSVLLLHEKNFSGAYWEQTDEVLQKAVYRVIIPDQTGFGTIETNAFAMFVLILAQNTKALLDSLQVSKIAVLGTPWAVCWPHALH